jgi:hypothetical protein
MQVLALVPLIVGIRVFLHIPPNRYIPAFSRLNVAVLEPCRIVQQCIQDIDLVLGEILPWSELGVFRLPWR